MDKRARLRLSMGPTGLTSLRDAPPLGLTRNIDDSSYDLWMHTPARVHLSLDEPFTC